MKCHQQNCEEEAKYKIIHLGSEEVNYCENHLRAYQNIMDAMGSPRALVFAIEPELK